MNDFAREVRADVAGRSPDDLLPFAFEEWTKLASQPERVVVT